MEKETRQVRYDLELQVEAYRFQGIMQNFPNHFHEYYVIGYVESGKRLMTCNHTEYEIEPGDMVLLNPGDNHACRQIDENPLDWRCVNIKADVIAKIADMAEQGRALPIFATPVARQAEAAVRLRDLHQAIMEGQAAFHKEEQLYFLIEDLLADYTRPEPAGPDEVTAEIQLACDYMQTHFQQTITLRELCEITGLKKYTLLRYFTRQRGITPYQYLETVRVSAAKRLLEQGRTPMEAAMQAGFCDQSHFTRFFKNYIGLTPRQYRNIFCG